MPIRLSNSTKEIKLVKSLFLIIKLIVSLQTHILSIISREGTIVREDDPVHSSSESDTENPEKRQISYCTNCAKKKHFKYQHPFEFPKRALHNNPTLQGGLGEEPLEYETD